ncbi:MAG: DUF262 domain-containing protein [Rhodocyclaceae bacterium]|jgi:hypothetical protein|nr:DUF262 domain-containing protein [Rhodocyclaceae bacterium]
MKTNKRPWPLSTLSNARGIRQRIDTNPDFQRPAVWSSAQKQLLIDSMLREYDVPKMYWRKVGEKPDRYDVVDGQQRLRAIWSFVDGEFNLPKNADPIDDMAIAGCSYQNLPDELQIRFDQYTLDVVVLEDTDEDEVREMFLRLQNGTSLKAQEKRNAMPGRMRDFVRSLTKHPFFGRVGFANSRFTHDHVAAQLVCLELQGGPTNVKDGDLNRMYKSEEQFDVDGKLARTVRKTLDLLAEVFVDKTPELERYNVVTLYGVIAELQRAYVLGEIKAQLREWFLDFEVRRRAQETLDAETAEPEWVAYKEKISHSTDAQESIRFRLDFLMRDLLSRFPGLSLKDEQRDFTYSQKLAIFRRDHQTCQLKIKCDGVRVVWDDWHCDHKVPWSKGGKTTVENGQVACPACNLSKGAG